jgi:hypothetical protein
VPPPQPQGDGPLQLVPAPPGADARGMSDQRTVDDGNPLGPMPAKATPNALTRPRAPTGPVVGAEGPRATSKRVANEPRFVTSQRPVTFEHIYDEEPAAARKRSKAPLLILVVALAAGGGIAAALVLRDHGSSKSATREQDPPGELDAAPRQVPVAADGGVPVPLAVDAAVIVDVPADGGTKLAVDAGTPHVHRDAGINPGKKPDAGVSHDKLTARGTVAIQVITKPDGASVYEGNSYRGVGGVTLEEAPGKKVKVKCTLPGYDPGYVDLKFDGNTEVTICKPIRPKRCVGNLHNPFDDCPDPEPPE